MKNQFWAILALAVAGASLTLSLGSRAAQVVHADSTPTTCDATTLNGAYGYTLSGYAYDANYNIYISAAVGRFVADGNGGVTGSDSMNFDSSIFKRKITGTYTINSDCTGSVTLTYDDGTNKAQTVHGDIIAVNNGKEVNFAQTDAPFMVTAVMKKVNQ